jgi:uroporphyrinogen decarboxylase
MEAIMFPHELKIEPAPDFGRLEDVFTRRRIPDRVPFCELFTNIESEVLKVIGKEPEGAPPDSGSPEWTEWVLRHHIAYMFWLAYDYVNIGSSNFCFPTKPNPHATTDHGERSYFLGSSHTIASREDFEKYAWPSMPDVDYSPLDKLADLIPEGMKAIAGGPGGILENVMWLMGFEGISYLLYDDEPLVRDMFDAVGSRMVQYFDNAASYEVVGAAIMGDDMGFKTQTMLDPGIYRKYLFPWHKKVVDAVHGHGKPIILHACGNVIEVMPDILACGWDARHSFEDAIEPIWEAKQKYGDDIAVIGGFDMDKICRMSEQEVRAHTRFLIEECAPGGGWALGTGNSVANYVPVTNLLAMLEEGYLAGTY